jgi:putative transposase
MDDRESPKHTRWECKYPIVFIPKCRHQKLYQQLGQHLGEVFGQVARQRESQILEGI